MDQEQRVALAKATVLQQLLNSPGWRVASEIADEAVREAEKRVMTCTEEKDIVPLQRKAQAAQEFLDDFVSLLFAAANIQIAETADDFVTVSCE